MFLLGLTRSAHRRHRPIVARNALF